MAKNKSWTTSEEQYLVDQINKNPNNIKLACEQAGIALGRTTGACMHRWYNVASKGSQTCFLTVSNKHVARNRKNGAGVASKPSIFQRILKLLNL